MTYWWKLFCLLAVSVVLLACGLLAAGTPAPATPVADLTLPPSGGASDLSPLEDTGALAREHLEVLAEDIGPRLPGSTAEAEAAAYIRTTFEALGYATELQRFAFTTDDEDSLRSANVVAVKPGLSSEEIIVGAHYDSSDEGEGADDNASGVAVLLEVATRLKDVETPYTIRFIAFGAEENDLNGSQYYVDQLTAAEIYNIVGMINLDGLIAGDIAYVYGDTGVGSLHDWILAQARKMGLPLEGRPAEDLDNLDGTPCDCADYGPFQEVGIPFAFFETANWGLGDEDGTMQVDPQFGEAGMIRHTSYDTARAIDRLFPGRIDQHLRLFVTLLVETLTWYIAAN